MRITPEPQSWKRQLHLDVFGLLVEVQPLTPPRSPHGKLAAFTGGKRRRVERRRSTPGSSCIRRLGNRRFDPCKARGLWNRRIWDCGLFSAVISLGRVLKYLVGKQDDGLIPQ